MPNPPAVANVAVKNFMNPKDLLLKTEFFGICKTS
jgi:hypothetical protein